MTNGTRRGWWVSVTPRPLFTPWKDPVPIVQDGGWAPGPVWTDAENLAPTGIRSPERPARSLSLYRLSYPGPERERERENASGINLNTDVLCVVTLHYLTLSRGKLTRIVLNPLNAELNPICYLLALLGAHHFLHVSRIRVKSLTLRLLMSYIYMEHPFLMLLCHTQWRTTVGRTPPDEWLARRRDLYLTTHDTHNRQISHRGHGYLSVVSVVCCQVEVSATSWSLVQRSHTDCAASSYVI